MDIALAEFVAQETTVDIIPKTFIPQIPLITVYDLI